MSAYLQAYLGKFELASDEVDFALNNGAAAAITLTEAEYYGAGYDPGTANDVQLCEHIEAQIQAEVGDYADNTCRLSLSTGLVTFDFKGHTTTITWTDTALRDLLGFTANCTGASTYTGTYPMKYLWLPYCGPSDYPVDILQFWEPVSSSVVHQAPGNEACGTEGELVNQALLEYPMVDREDVQKPGSYTDNAELNQTLQSFWENVAHKTMPIRCVMDRDTYAASTDFKVGLWSGRGGKVLGRFLDWVRASQGKSSHTLWDCTMYLVEHTE